MSDTVFTLGHHGKDASHAWLGSGEGLSEACISLYVTGDVFGAKTSD